MSLQRFVFLIFFLSVGYSPSGLAQSANLAQQDLSQVRVDQLSDAQISQYLERAEAQGITDQQIESQAVIRGMARSEVSKLMRRIRRVRQSGGRQPGSSSGPRQSGVGVADSSQYSRRDTALDYLTEEEKKIFGFELFNNEELTFRTQLQPGDSQKTTR